MTASIYSTSRRFLFFESVFSEYVAIDQALYRPVPGASRTLTIPGSAVALAEYRERLEEMIVSKRLAEIRRDLCHRLATTLTSVWSEMRSELRPSVIHF